MTESLEALKWQRVASQAIQIEHKLRTEIERLRAENAKLCATLEELRAWCADKGDLDGELMAQAALTNKPSDQDGDAPWDAELNAK